MNSISIKDETASGKVLHEIALQFENEYITARELITERIAQEIKNYNKKISKFEHVLVKPSDLELKLNRKVPVEIDVEKQVFIALDAFQKNGFFILVDDEQVVELDQKFLIDTTTNVTFFKLTPLVGG